MYRVIFILLFLTQPQGAAYSQVSSADSQTLQTLLKEVRQLRQDFQAATIAIERAQILIHRLQEQEISVGRALQRSDDARAKLALAQTNRQNLATRIKNIEDQQSGLSSSVESKETADVVSQLKGKLAVSLTQEQEAQTRVTECEEQVRAEQAKSDALQDQLNQLDKTFNNSVTH